VSGRAHVFGDNLTTDDVIAGKYKHRTMSLDELSRHAMENIRPSFAGEFMRGDVVVGGDNFGCGSSREQAPLVLRHIGTRAVLARSFARIFFRNAVNVGLTVLEVDTTGIEEGDEVEVETAAHRVVVRGGEVELPVRPLPPSIERIVDAGGLLAYARAGGLS
jgi:3-isopropylmalate/(R)-2-methylmalate dehydratase small subunit